MLVRTVISGYQPTITMNPTDMLIAPIIRAMFILVICRMDIMKFGLCDTGVVVGNSLLNGSCGPCAFPDCARGGNLRQDVFDGLNVSD